MTQQIFIGVDGGATKSTIRVEDENGNLIGQAVSGPANIRISVDQAWHSIHSALNKILQSHSVSLGDGQFKWHAGMGLAGWEVVEAYQEFISRSHDFDTLIATSDSHTACLGAHNGNDGSIIIAGTGVVGYQIERGRITKVGGWGFPHDDEGGGAWIGLQGVKFTLQWLDGRLPYSELAKKIFAFFDDDQNRLISWANHANSAAFAEIAPFVIQQSQKGDEVAIKILQSGAECIDRIGVALDEASFLDHNQLPCSLIGGVVPFLLPFLGSRLRARLRPCLATPSAGAIMLIRSHLKA